MRRERATVFGEFAADYDRWRPGYPPAVIDLLVAGDPELVVDVGCGTGKAARLVAARGVAVLGVEPDARMAAVARSHGIDVVVSRFEDWQPQPCDVLYAAQAWHWVDTDQGVRQAAAALRSGGRWVALWNDDAPSPVREVVAAVGAELAAELIPHRGLDDPQFSGHYAEALRRTGAFAALTVDRLAWCDRLTSDELVARLATHSAHALLTPDRREAFDTRLLAGLGGPGVALEVPYVTFVFSAERR